MNETEKKYFIAIVIEVLIAVGIAFAGSLYSVKVGNIPLFGPLIGWAFLVNWIAFIPAYKKQTEKFFDLTGSITYITTILLAFFLNPAARDARSFLMLGVVLVWALRLGIFLFSRIQKDGKDGRFDDLKPSFITFLHVWTLQGLWVTLTLLAALMAMTSTTHKSLGIWGLVGGLVWLFGFVIEVVADNQKSAFRKNPANKGKFINTGLWSRSRHPNYFGEIALWIGVMLIAVPVLQSWQWIALISPIFVTLLLTKISGIPMLEKRADEKWGGQKDYKEYKKSTPVLIPKL
ncbi:MAG: DUF1295 domain-containing protein [Chloroflexi bacterium]|nr:DUF1295 domain-containing protein [Chloroflexota bacterium]